MCSSSASSRCSSRWPDAQFGVEGLEFGVRFASVSGPVSNSKLQTPNSKLSLRDPVSTIPGVGPSRAAALQAAGVVSVADFLLALPFRYEDRTRFGTVQALRLG